jgi:hypothetical protein
MQKCSIFERGEEDISLMINIIETRQTIHEPFQRTFRKEQRECEEKHHKSRRCGEFIVERQHMQHHTSWLRFSEETGKEKKETSTGSMPIFETPRASTYNPHRILFWGNKRNGVRMRIEEARSCGEFIGNRQRTGHHVFLKEADHRTAPWCFRRNAKIDNMSSAMSVFARKTWTLSKRVLRERDAETNITTCAATFEIMYVSEERGRTCQLAMLVLEDAHRRTEVWRILLVFEK